MYIIVLACILATGYAQCPPPEALRPCKCEGDTPDAPLINSTLDCSAIKIKEEFLNIKDLRDLSLGHVVYGTIRIKSSVLSLIPAGAFGRASAEVYEITDNLQLDTIEPKFMHAEADPVVINVARNKINSFPFQDLEGLTQIRFLVFLGNELSKIPSNAFSTLEGIEDIILTNNQISDIGPNAFRGMKPYLNAIVLTGNQLSDVKPNTFCLDSSPNFLVLNSNGISNVQANAFGGPGCGNAYPVELVLDNNELTTLPELVFSNLLTEFQAANSTITVEGNEFVCDCDMLWLRTHPARDVLQGLLCTQPPPGNPVPLDQVPQTVFDTCVTPV